MHRRATGTGAGGAGGRRQPAERAARRSACARLSGPPCRRYASSRASASAGTVDSAASRASSRAIARHDRQRDARGAGTAPRTPRRRSASTPARRAAAPPRSARAPPPARHTDPPTSDGAAAPDWPAAGSAAPPASPAHAAAAAPRSLSENDSNTRSAGVWPRSSAACSSSSVRRLADQQMHRAQPADRRRDGGAVDAGCGRSPPAARAAPRRPARAGRTGGAAASPTPCTASRSGLPRTAAKPLIRRMSCASVAAAQPRDQRLGRGDLRQRHDETVEIVVLVRAVQRVVMRRPRRQIVLGRRAEPEQHRRIEPALAAPAPASPRAPSTPPISPRSRASVAASSRSALFSTTRSAACNWSS